MKRAVAVVALVVGCRGRFDAVPDALVLDPDAEVDASAIPARCTATPVTSFDLGMTGATDVAATKLPDGYAVGVIFGTSSFFGVHLDSSLMPNTNMPFQTTPVTGFTGSYQNASLFFDGTNLDGGLSIADGTCYLKTFQQDMQTFLGLTMETGGVGEPNIGRSSQQLFGTWFSGTQLHYIALGADGVATGADYNLDYVTQPIVEVSVASGPSLAVVASLPDNTCELYALDIPFSASGAGYGGGMCSEPYLSADGTDTHRMVYTFGGSIWATEIRAVVNTILYNAGTELAPGSRPKIARIAGVDWVVWKQPTGLRMAPIDDFSEAPIAFSPRGAPDAYEVAGDRVFAVWGTDLYAISCP